MYPQQMSIDQHPYDIPIFTDWFIGILTSWLIIIATKTWVTYVIPGIPNQQPTRGFLKRLTGWKRATGTRPRQWVNGGLGKATSNQTAKAPTAGASNSPTALLLVVPVVPPRKVRLLGHCTSTKWCIFLIEYLKRFHGPCNIVYIVFF